VISDLLDEAGATAAPPDDEFIELVCQDEELLRAEFDALIARVVADAATVSTACSPTPDAAGSARPPGRRRGTATTRGIGAGAAVEPATLTSAGRWSAHHAKGR